MSIVAAIRQMLATGMSVENALTAAEAFEAQNPVRSARQERNARYYQARKERLNKTDSDAIKTHQDAIKTLSDDVKTPDDASRADIYTTRAHAVIPVGDTNVSPPIDKKLLPSVISKKSKNDSGDVLEILGEVLSAETAAELIRHRTAKKAKLSAFAARLLVKKFLKWGDPEEAAQTMIVRGWQGFDPAWMENQPRAGPQSSIGAVKKGGFGAIQELINEAQNEQFSEQFPKDYGSDSDVQLLPFDGGSRR